MSTISKAAAGFILAALVTVTGAWAGTAIEMEGDYGKVSWTSWDGKKGYSGYLFATHQPDSTTYLYYVVRCGSEPPATGYGVIPKDSLWRDENGDLRLSVDTSELSDFVTSGGGLGSINVVWSPIGVVETMHAGASGIQTGAISEVTQGSWSSGVAAASGFVLSWKIGAQQSAETGQAFGATTEISAGK